MFASNEQKDSENFQLKNRLAVFEQVTCKEKRSEKVDKKSLSFKKNSFKRDLSESELIIDDDEDNFRLQPPKKRNRGVRLEEEPLSLLCGWIDCQKDFNNYELFIKHFKEHLDEFEENDDLFECKWENCTYVTANASLLKQHLHFHGYHVKLKNVGCNVLERMNLPKCTQASEFVIPENAEGYECDWFECGAFCVSVYELYSHVQIHIKNNPKYCAKGETISCEWKGCTYKFSSQYKLADHLRSHTKERVVACPTCENMFATKTKFYDHRKRQLPLNMQSYQCSQCSKLFPSERLLRDHMRSHINLYKCTLCDMTCPKPSVLATHIRFRHLSERPIQCNICKHKCVSKQGLESHLMTHIAEKLFACDECSFRCRSLYGMDRHYHTAHGQAWSTYECHCCQMKFTRGNLLTKHLMKAHDFHWPSGHSRFRYKEDTDGIFRLQTVRYESIEVTEEMIRTNSNTEATPPISNSCKYDLRKRQSSPDKPPSYVLMVAENGDQNVVCPTDNSIVLMINDVDDKGNIVNSEVLQSNEMKIMN